MRFLLPALLLIAVATARASDATWHLSLQLRSLHEHTSEIELHDTTPGIGVIRETPGHWLTGAGVFRNSLARTAGYAYVGKQWPIGKIQAGAIAGVTHHYNFNHGGIVPLAAALVSVPMNDRWCIDIIGIPHVTGYTYATLHFAVRCKIR